MTDSEKKMMEMLGISEDDFQPIDKDELLLTAYINSELMMALMEVDDDAL